MNLRKIFLGESVCKWIVNGKFTQSLYKEIVCQA